jgi:hypothetical protein
MAGVDEPKPAKYQSGTAGQCSQIDLRSWISSAYSLSKFGAGWQTATLIIADDPEQGQN